MSRARRAGVRCAWRAALARGEGGGYGRGVLPLILLAGATAAGSALAYGTHPDLAYWRHGLALIMLARRVQWLLVLLSVLPCLVLLGMVVAGRRRAWWLLGLAPVLALFIRSYAPGYRGNWAVAEQPMFVAAASAGAAAPAPDDWVIGLVQDDTAYALPMAQLYERPAVIVGEPVAGRVLLLWSATANRAVAAMLTRSAHARDLEIVSSPADSLLLLDHRLGSFVCGVTGRLVDGERAPQFGGFLSTQKMTWADWLALHLNSRVLVGFDGEAAAPPAESPRRPVLPLLHFRQADGTVPTAPQPIECIDAAAPCAVRAGVDLSSPLNTDAGGVSLVLLRDPHGDACRAFDRHLKEDLFLSFLARHDRKTPEVFMADSETGSLWTAAGRCVAGTLRGARLHELTVDPDLYLPVMRFWIPQLEVIGKPQ